MALGSHEESGEKSKTHDHATSHFFSFVFFAGAYITQINLVLRDAVHVHYTPDMPTCMTMQQAVSMDSCHRKVAHQGTSMHDIGSMAAIKGIFNVK